MIVWELIKAVLTILVLLTALMAIIVGVLKILAEVFSQNPKRID